MRQLRWIASATRRHLPSARPLDRSDAETTTATVNGHDATVTTRSGATVVYWRTGGATIGVVVDPDGDRALELARRVEEWASGIRGP